MKNDRKFNPVAVFWHLFAFIVGLTVEIEYEFIGTLRISELILLGYLGVMAVTGNAFRLFQLPYSKLLASMGLLWLLAQYVSDSINNTSNVDFLKGHAMIGMILVSVAACVLLFQPDPNRYASYLLGLSFSRLYDAFLGTIDDLQSQEYWDRFIAGWAGNFIVFVCLFILYRKQKITVCAILLGAYGAVSILFQSRSHGLIYIAMAFLFWYGCRDVKLDLPFRRPKQLLIAGGGLFIVFLIVFQIYVHFGLKGDLGAGPRAQLIRSRNPHNPISVVIAGRGSIPIAMRAISDRPWIGHGSRAVNQKYTNAHARRNGIRQIPAHSCILSAWVFAGVLSFPFWVSVLVIHFRLWKSAINRGHSQFVLLSSFLLADGMWHLWFSPLGYARFPWPPLLAVNIILYQRLLDSTDGSPKDLPATSPSHTA